MPGRPSKELIQLASRLTLKKPSLQIVPDNDDYPWFIRELQNQLQAMEKRKELLLPNLRDENDSLVIFSDYGGESPDSSYHTYSFLICAWNQTGLFHEKMKELRKETGLDNPFKEISFKDFRYGPVRRALPSYLSHLSNLVNGYLLTVVIEKAVPSIYGTNKKRAHWEIVKALSDAGLGEWKPEVAEKLLRVTHFCAFLVALLSRPGHKVMWMTDHDSIAPNSTQHLCALNLFGNLLNHYCPHELGVVGGAVPFEEKDSQMLDLLSAADIVAGSVEHYMTRAKLLKEELTVKGEADKVLCWLSGQGVSLKKHLMIIRSEGDGMIAGTLKFHLKQENPEAIFVPIPV